MREQKISWKDDAFLKILENMEFDRNPDLLFTLWYFGNLQSLVNASKSSIPT